MLKNVCLFVLFFWLPCMVLGKEYVVRYQRLTCGSIFYIETKQGERVGKVIRERKDESVIYTFFAEGNIWATGETESHLANTFVHLFDRDKHPIGWFAAEIHAVYPMEYKIFSTANQLVAVGYMNWIGSAFSLTDPDNPKRFIASFFRPMYKLFFDNWHFDIHEDGVVDFRLLSVMGVFQAACDLNFESIELKDRSSE